MDYVPGNIIHGHRRGYLSIQLQVLSIAGTDPSESVSKTARDLVERIDG